MHLSKQSSSTKKWLLVLATFCFLGLWSWGTEQTPRSEAAVELISFTATANTNNSAVRLRWETAVEIDTAGYRLKRTNSSNEFITVTYFGEQTSLIPGDATGLGAIYEAQDTAVSAGNTYIYTLVEIDNSGGQDEIATAVVNLGNGQPTNTPTPTATATGGLTLPPTSTPTVAVQASPTSTATPATQLNPTATSTPEPTNNNNNGSNNNNNDTTSGSTSATNNPSSGNTNGNNAPSTTNNNNASSGGASVAEASEAQPAQAQQQTGETLQEETPEEEREEGATDPLNETGDSSEINDESIDGSDDTAVSTPYPATTNESETEALDPAGYQGTEPSNELETSTSPSQIGQNNSDNTSPENNENQASGNNNLILWGAFLAAMSVFIAGIIGSLLLFMRRR